jgi:hypothetical protein
MKKSCFLFSVFVLLVLTSCFDEAKFRLTNNQTVTVDRLSLDEFKVGQKVWLIRGYAPHASDWEILSDHTIGQIGFEPKKDTLFVFKSMSGNYQRRIALGTLIEKK